MSTGDPVRTICSAGVVPVVTLDRPEQAMPLAEALLAGGLPVVEITYRSSAAPTAIAHISERYPEMLVGAGTVTSAAMAEQAHAQGARFAVSPGLSTAVVQRAQHIGLQFWPGVCTPTEIDAALSLGCKVLKFFPAGALGGPTTVKAMLAPYLHLGVQVIPTGGIDEDVAPAYWALDGVAAVGGSWIAPKELVTPGNWAEVTRRARAAVVRYNAMHGQD